MSKIIENLEIYKQSGKKFEKEMERGKIR